MFDFDFLLLSFRYLNDNDLTELPTGVFDSLASLSLLYVLWLVVERFVVSSLLEPDISSSSLALAQRDRARQSLCSMNELDQFCCI